jgi:hypothetical protein
LTTAESFCAANKDDAPIDELSDAELIRRASRELASATIVVAQGLMLQPDIAVTRPREVSIWLARWRNALRPSPLGLRRWKPCRSRPPLNEKCPPATTMWPP